MTCRRIILLAAAALWTAEAVAQSTRVRGRVTDASTGLPLQFASVVFSGTTVGITTDEQGIYALETRDTTARIEVSIVGYAPQSRRVERGTFSQVDFALDPVRFDIGQVVITPGDNPAHPILEEVVRRRPQNDPEYYDTYCCTTYTKMELDLTNLRPSFRSKRLQRNFGFIFSYMDTSALTGAAYLPAMISESSAELYHSRSPQFTREVIRASRISGVENSEAVAQFTGGMHGDVNFYDNFIDLFDVRFASPLASGGRTYYDYFLVDSLDVKGRKTYKIRFHPKRLTTPVLDGEIHIDSATYALQSASVRMPRGVNVNWIRHLRIDNENRLTENGRWFRLRDRVSAEFSLTTADSSKLVSFIGTREIAYSDVRIDEPIPDEVLRMDNRVQIAGGNPNRRDEAYWEAVRPYTLSERERGIYAMVDSVQRVPLYRNIYTLVNTILVGHWNTKYIGIGPYYKIASFNKLEGFRMQLGGRTTTEVSRRVRLSGYAAYGTRDGRFKGGGSIEAVFGRTLTRKLTLSGRHDVLQLGAGDNALTESNILSSILSRGDQRLSMVNRGEADYEHEWRHGVTARLGARLQRVYSNRYVPMIRPDGTPANSISDAALRAELRFAKDETVYRMPFDKQSLGSKYPVVTLSAAIGIPGLLPGASEYYRFEGGIRYRPELPPIGYSTITVRGGHIVGTVPYPLLKLHEGNGTYFYDPYAFSCMDYYEFASDSWVAWFYEHHFKGLLLGRLPLIKKLRWREVLVFKGVWGTLSHRNDGSRPGSGAPLLFPAGMSSVSTPYLEAGFGVENIFRLLRIDCIWRLTHREPVAGEEVQRFAVNLGVQLKF
ncbi:DUF5686 and carboxypeptidase-like regulatory domain-containing protein [Alistipes dispar]|uniref:DUF5686 and carboxypeptidase-like regulatory domain-containing protein n=1 Tax=Alistipes dispar TaxID=2585119 RepID=UPI002FDED7A8